SAAVTSVSAVAVHDDLTACKTTVSVRSSDNKTTCGINKIFRIIIYHIRGDHSVKNIFPDICMNLFLRYVRIMLCGAYYRVDPYRFSFFTVLHSHLGLAVRSQIFQSSVLTYLRKLTGKLMSHIDSIGHIFLCLIGGETKLDSLVSRSDSVDLVFSHFCFQSLVNAKSNICRLFVNRCDHTTGIRVKTIFSTGISDFSYRISYNFLDVHITCGSNLSHYQNKTCRDGCLTGYTTHGILLNQSVKDSVGNSVADLIRMSLCN